MINHTYVVCAYGDSPYLEACIQSLKAQTLVSQVVLYTSTPSSYITSICERYDVTIFTGKGGGIGADWNQALQVVKTRYATIAHQDDLYAPTYGEKVLARMSENSLISYSNYDEIKDEQVIPRQKNLKIKDIMLKTMALFPGSRWLRHLVLGLGNPISCPAVTYDLESLRGFAFDETMKVSLDWYAWYVIAQRSGRFEFVPESLMWHRIHEASETTNSIENNSRTIEDQWMYERFWPKPVANLLMRYYIKSQESNS